MDGVAATGGLQPGASQLRGRIIVLRVAQPCGTSPARVDYAAAAAGISCDVPVASRNQRRRATRASLARRGARLSVDRDTLGELSPGRFSPAKCLHLFYGRFKLLRASWSGTVTRTESERQSSETGPEAHAAVAISHALVAASISAYCPCQAYCICRITLSISAIGARALGKTIMRLGRFGRTGRDVSKIGFGAWAIGSDGGTSRRMMRARRSMPPSMPA